MATSVRLQTHLDWDQVYESYKTELLALERILDALETKYSLRLSPGALEALLVPIVEALQEEEKISVERQSESLDLLFQVMRNDPDPRDQGRISRSSRSVLRAFARTWCRIPPFCGPEEE